MWCLHVIGKSIKGVVSSTYGYHDVAVHGGQVYAATLASPHKVDVYDISTWLRLREMPTPCCSSEGFSWHRLQVTDDRVLLCCYDRDKLQVLSHSGELLQTHGRSRREVTEDDIVEQTASDNPVYDPGVLCGPRLCQVDADGSALVANEGTDKLLVMRADGTWGVVDLDQPVSRPTGAAWCNGSLYVVGKYNIARFS